MSFVVPEEISFIVNSNPASGAINLSNNGSQFQVQLEEPLVIPKDAMNINLSVEEATVWWTVPNISASIGNNQMYITGQPQSGGAPQQYIITLEDGLYDLSGLEQAIHRELYSAGATHTPSPLISLTADEATQRVGIIFNYNDVSVDFTPTNTPREILGFDSRNIGPFILFPHTELGDSVARFNQINSFLIHSDLVGRGIRINNKYNQTISQVLIDVPAGSQIISQPRHPSKCNAPELADRKISQFRMWLTDENDNLVDTNGEYWSVRMVLHYVKPYVVARPELNKKF